MRASETGQHWHVADRRKTCIACDTEKPIAEFYRYAYRTRQGKDSFRYDSRCKPCKRAQRRQETKKNPGRNATQSRAWRRANPDQSRDQHAKYRNSDSGKVIRAKCQRMRKARQRAGASDTPAVKAIYAEAMRVEAVIQDCPVFDLPELGKKIHVDHIKPLAKGGKHVAANLQLLAAGLNMRKGVSCPR